MAGIALAIVEPPEAAAVEASGPALQRRLLGLADELAHELAGSARIDPRYELAAQFAGELRAELKRIADGVARVTRRGQKPAAARSRSARVAERRARAFRVQREALGRTCELVGEFGIAIGQQQLADLHLGERTRRVFEHAGLTYVGDVTDLTPQHALGIPRLTPNSLAELRAAILLALDAAGGRPRPMLPPPGDGDDLFDDLVAGVNGLPARERDVLVLRTGVEDRIHSPDEVAQTLGMTPELVEHLENRGLNALLARPAGMEAAWLIEELCARFGLAWDDERLPTAIAALYPNTRARFARLGAALMVEKGRVVAELTGKPFRPPRGVPSFEALVVAALGRFGDLSAETLTRRVLAAFATSANNDHLALEVGERVRVLGPAVMLETGVFRLPDTPSAGLSAEDDRRIRSLNALIGALQRLGSARVASLTLEVNRRLPHQYRVHEHYVRTWLTGHPELFAQSDEDRFRLASLDIDLMCGTSTGWLPAEAASAMSRPMGPSQQRLHDRKASAIADLLRQSGPLPIARIRSHLYGWFIGHPSVDAVIEGDTQQRFVRLHDGAIGLRDTHSESEMVD